MSTLTKVKAVKNAILYKDDKGVEFIKLENVRASYPFIGTPGEDENEQGVKSKSWRMVAMLPKETHLEAKNLVKEVIERLLKANDANVPTANWCLTNGNDKEDETMHGHWLVSCADKKRRPTARDKQGKVISVQEPDSDQEDTAATIQKIDDTFYGGCYVNVLIRPWYFNGTSKASTKKYPKRVPAGLQAVQFLKDGTPFGSGRVDDSDVWGSEEGGSDDGDDGL